MWALDVNRQLFSLTLIMFQQTSVKGYYLSLWRPSSYISPKRGTLDGSFGDIQLLSTEYMRYFILVWWRPFWTKGTLKFPLREFVCLCVKGRGWWGWFYLAMSSIFPTSANPPKTCGPNFFLSWKMLYGLKKHYICTLSFSLSHETINNLFKQYESHIFIKKKSC